MQGRILIRFAAPFLQSVANVTLLCFSRRHVDRKFIWIDSHRQAQFAAT